VVFSKDERRILTADDQAVHVWSVERKEEILLITPDATVYGAGYSPNETIIITSSSHNVQLWNASTGELMRSFDQTLADAPAQISPNGHLIATAPLFGPIQLWDPESGSKINELSESEGEVKSFEFSSDSKFLCAATDVSAYIWEIGGKSRPDVVSVTNEPEAMTVVAISNDTGIVALGDLSGRIHGWNRKAKKANFSTDILADGYASVIRFTPDDGKIIAGFDTGDIKVIDARNGSIIFSLVGHTDKITAAVTNKEGTILITASVDKTVKVWSLHSGLLLADMTGHGDEVSSVALSFSGHILASASDRTIRLWSVFADQQELIDEARGLPYRQLGLVERRVIFRQ
jgi:WD40 repeat protein